MIHRKPIQQGTAVILLLFAELICAADIAVLQKVSHPQQADTDIILDTRPLASCRQSTLAGAWCLPIEDFIAPRRRLANWSGILWLLGTVGLSGSEHILVVGEKSERRHILAGLLTLAGQRKVSIVDEPVSALLTGAEKTAAGSQRSTTRLEVFTAAMRSELIVLREDLKTSIRKNTVILDGRSEAEFYGTTIRASRGGHIPGAFHHPTTSLQNSSKNIITNDNPPVSYAHDSIDGLAYFSKLLVSGQSSRLYTAGWVEWASDGNLPIDSASYPAAMNNHSTDDQSIQNNPPVSVKSAADINGVTVLVGTITAVCLIAIGYFTGRTLPGKQA